MARRRDEPFNPFTAGSSPRGRGRDFHKKRQAAEEPEPVEKAVDRKTLQEAMIAKVLAATEPEASPEQKQVVLVEEELPQTDDEAIPEVSVPSQPESEPVVIDDVLPSVKPAEEPASQPASEPVAKTESKTAVKPAAKPVPKPAVKTSPKSEDVKEIQDSESRLADLKRRSKELAVRTGHETAQVPAGPSSATASVDSQTSTQAKPVGIIHPSPKPKRRFRKTKTGGGRQPKQSKLNRRKQLEFRFDIRKILEDSTVLEEHRSNLLGQVWAKGERIGVDAANEYIDQKHQEGIIDDEMAEKLHRLVRSYTTKR